MTGLEVAAVAALAMLCTNVIGTVEAVASAKDRGWLAGWLDAAAWIVAITTTTLTVTALQGNSFTEKALVVVLVSAANVLGTKMGTVFGAKFVKTRTVAERLDALEAYNLTSHH